MSVQPTPHPPEAPESPLLAQHKLLGASFTDFAGWQMPLKYSSELAEHKAVRSSVGLFDLSHMGEISVSGPQAGAVLDYALAGKLSAVAVGRAKYSLLCAPDGGVIDDLVVYRLGAEEFLVVANAANAPVVADKLAVRAKGFDALIEDQSRTTALIAVQGPLALDVVSALCEPAAAAIATELKYYAAARTTVAGIEVVLARTGYTGEDGFELYAVDDDAAALWQGLLAAVTEAGGLPAGLACRDTLRLEAGMALYGHELTLRTDPFSAGLARVVDLSKNFVGADALKALQEKGFARTLVGLAGTGRRAAREGYPVFGSDGLGIGEVTSGALSPTLSHPVALAYVDTAYAAVGTEVSVDIRGKHEAFTVTKPPFYRRPR